jgi:hypothetical protein
MLVFSGAQSWHDSGPVDAELGLKVPGRHSEQEGDALTESAQYDPGAQSEHVAEPGTEYLPAAHGRQSSMLFEFARGLK